MIARYDLSRQIAGFDFFHWLLYVQSLGATEIVIDTSRPKFDKWDCWTTGRRIRSIILPGPALAGLPCRIGTDGETHKGYLGALLDSARKGNPIRRLRSVLPPAMGPTPTSILPLKGGMGSDPSFPFKGKAGMGMGERYTVTLRRTARAAGRNSNEMAWRTFAAEIGARVIEDYDVMPLGLHERLALYAGAEMNFGVSNGPVTLGLLSEYPMMAFDFAKSAKAIERQSGMKFGEQLPWRTKDQFQVWEPDELPVIREHFQAWRATRVPAPEYLAS